MKNWLVGKELSNLDSLIIKISIMLSIIAFKSSNLSHKLFIFSCAMTNLFILETLMRFTKLHGSKTSSSVSMGFRKEIESELEVSAPLMSEPVFFNMQGGEFCLRSDDILFTPCSNSARLFILLLLFH